MKQMMQSGSMVMYRLGVLSRVLAAILGGYVLSALCTVMVSHGLPLGRADAVMTATMLSFIIYTCAVIWVFAVHSALRAWIGILIPTLVLAAIYWFAIRSAS
ncbi:DUF3649 domain-containing protein [Herbaspirillum lusitanum]|uniref:DUF3649 domain-containing protein n=1 Tax=Herbaspirillum lusitanum TaxID=213312 RepID=A0ABW9ABA7_9BURK